MRRIPNDYTKHRVRVALKFDVPTLTVNKSKSKNIEIFFLWVRRLIPKYGKSHIWDLVYN